jgi:hypothetical protein
MRPLGEIEKPGIPAGLPPWGLVGYSSLSDDPLRAFPLDLDATQLPISSAIHMSRTAQRNERAGAVGFTGKQTSPPYMRQQAANRCALPT